MIIVDIELCIFLLIIIGLLAISVYSIYSIRYDRKYSHLVQLIELNKIELDCFNDHITEYKKYNNYLTYRRYIEFFSKYEDIYVIFKKYQSYIKKNSEFDEKLGDLLRLYSNKENLFEKYNKKYVKKVLEKESIRSLLSNIDGKSLDLQQREAVIVDEESTLIVAGAGSGKTLTIAGKVKYLIEKKGVNPNEILLISFTNASSKEMKNRIKDKLNIDISTFTFHKLGLNIISEVDGKKPTISEERKLIKIVENFLKRDIFKDELMSNTLVNFYGYYFKLSNFPEDFNNLSEYALHLKSEEFTTLKGLGQIGIRNQLKNRNFDKKTINGEQVKSYSELKIANFLYLNGIEYVYEGEYEIDTSTKSKRKYKPDFYLPQYDIYIEHFGVDKDFRAPWLDMISERIYLDSMKWKRNIHTAYDTKLIETYSYMDKEGVLLSILESKLKLYNVKFFEVNYNQILERIIDTNPSFYDQFIRLICTFIGLFKSNNFNSMDFSRLQNIEIEKNKFLSMRNRILLKIIKPIYETYEDILQKEHVIDFNDMINKATQYIELNRIKLGYKYIIIDEYQDISKSRYRLVKAIKDKTKAKLFVVGDDWQSIYRFAGSDISLFTNFDEYFGYHKLLKIERTYRNSCELIDTAGNFVMKNKKQIEKSLKSDSNVICPIKIYKYDNDFNKTIYSIINDILINYGDGEDILLLGRYSFEIDKINLRSLRSDFPGCKIEFLTVHKSKGLEADHVIILNAENNKLGFPSKISDDPILKLVLSDGDDYLFAEERRLFYVALTRCKKTTNIITPYYSYSTFVKEIETDNNVESIVDSINDEYNEKSICPRCGGKLRKHTNDYNSIFYGCENYPVCKYTLNSVNIDYDRKCPRCGDFLIKRKGKYGYFYGCNSFKYNKICEYTEKI